MLFYERWHLTLLSVSLLPPHDKLLGRVYSVADTLSISLPFICTDVKIFLKSIIKEVGARCLLLRAA